MQEDARIRFGWGLQGGLAIAAGEDVLVVVVDVLSFSTSVSIAAARGIEVLPLPWRTGEEEAVAAAGEHGAVLAGPRGGGGVSLSPASILAARDVRRIALPTPNGATLSVALAERGRLVAGCLRNASAVAARCGSHLQRSDSAVVAVVAAGERWPDGSLRPAVEDLWGAGAVLAALRDDRGWSAEAVAAAAAFRVASIGPLPLLEVESGRELAAAGFTADVRLASEIDADTAAPELVGGVFTASVPAPSTLRP